MVGVKGMRIKFKAQKNKLPTVVDIDKMVNSVVFIHHNVIRNMMITKV